MSQQIVAVDNTEPHVSVPKFTPGRRYIDENGALWEYCKFGGTVNTGDYVFVTKDGLSTVTQLTTTNLPASKVHQVGSLQNVNAGASGKYGWVFRGFGAHSGSFLASCVQDVIVGPTTTAGAVDDTPTTNILGLSLLTTITPAGVNLAWANGILMTAGFA